MKEKPLRPIDKLWLIVMSLALIGVGMSSWVVVYELFQQATYSKLDVFLWWPGYFFMGIVSIPLGVGILYMLNKEDE